MSQLLYTSCKRAGPVPQCFGEHFSSTQSLIKQCRQEAYVMYFLLSIDACCLYSCVFECRCKCLSRLVSLEHTIQNLFESLWDDLLTERVPDEHQTWQHVGVTATSDTPLWWSSVCVCVFLPSFLLRAVTILKIQENKRENQGQPAGSRHCLSVYRLQTHSCTHKCSQHTHTHLKMMKSYIQQHTSLFFYGSNSCCEIQRCT